MYINGKSAYEILPLTDYKSVHSIYNIVRKNGYEVRTKAGVKNPYLRHNYFENIDTEHKAYWLGFLMADDLSKYNIVPNKSHRENHIIKLKEPFMAHFIRGMFDGDGWIYIRKEYGNLTFGLCGTFTTMVDIEEYLRYELKIPKVKICNYKNKVPFFTHYSKNSLEKIYKYLYSNSTIYLKRKKEIFDKIYANTEVTN